jgi:biopolymer transport protein ExbD
MRKLTSTWGAWSADGLRMRFRPRSRISQAFLQVVPWLNFVVVLLLYLALARQLILAPGVVFDLPRAPFREGLRRGPRIVMVHVRHPAGPETFVFFDNVRYQTGLPQQAEQLRAELARAAARPDGRHLLLLADRRVPHGDVIELVNLARAVGVQRVNVAIKPE